MRFKLRFRIWAKVRFGRAFGLSMKYISSSEERRSGAFCTESRKHESSWGREIVFRSAWPSKMRTWDRIGWDGMEWGGGGVGTGVRVTVVRVE